MAGESLLQQAFAETGVQLDRIIDAYERTQPVSNYPRTLQTMFDVDILKQFIVLSPNEIQVIPTGYLDNQTSWNLTNGVLSYCEGQDNVPTDSVCSFDLTTFEITELDLGYQSQWIDSPQS